MCPLLVIFYMLLLTAGIIALVLAGLFGVMKITQHFDKQDLGGRG